MKYIVQTKPDLKLEQTFRLVTPVEWRSQFEKDTLREAIDEAKEAIELGTWKAENVRVIAVVAEFESKIEINIKEGALN